VREPGFVGQLPVYVKNYAEVNAEVFDTLRKTVAVPGFSGRGIY
jgi:hypothetical protein